MKSARVVAAFLLALLLGAGPAAASVADCCPPRELAPSTLAAAGCCGGCPSTLAPVPEPPSFLLKAARPDPGLAPGAAVPRLVVPLLEEAAVRDALREVAFPPRLSPVPLRI